MGARVGFGSRRDLLLTSLLAAAKCFEFEFRGAAFGPPYLFSMASKAGAADSDCLGCRERLLGER